MSVSFTQCTFTQQIYLEGLCVSRTAQGAGLWQGQSIECQLQASSSDHLEQLKAEKQAQVLEVIVLEGASMSPSYDWLVSGSLLWITPCNWPQVHTFVRTRWGGTMGTDSRARHCMHPPGQFRIPGLLRSQRHLENTQKNSPA